MMLFPDMGRKQYEDNDNFVFAAPCTDAEWCHMYAEAQVEPDDKYLPFVFWGEGPATFSRQNRVLGIPGDVVCIILREPTSSDEDALTTAAWIRVSEEFTGMIYAVGFVSGALSQSTPSIVCRTAGVNPKQVRHIEVPLIRSKA